MGIKSKRMRLFGNVSCIGQKKTSYRVYVWELYGKGQFVRLRRRREYIIKMNLKEIGC